MNRYKKLDVLFIFLGSLFIILAVSGVFDRGIRIAKASLPLFRSGNTLSSMQTSSATTTPSNGKFNTYLVTGAATSTLTFPSENFSALSLEMIWFASSSINSSLSIQLSSSDNGIDFYPYDNTRQGLGTQLGNITLAPTSTPLIWLPNPANATTTKEVKLDLIPSNWTRIVFSLATNTPYNTPRDTIGFYANVIGVGVHQ